jgi:short-subunit dehydrogenase
VFSIFLKQGFVIRESVMVDIKGKWVLITGASRGIGYEIALALAGLGCNLVLHSRSMTHTEKIFHKVIALGVKAHMVEADLSSPSEVKILLDKLDSLELDIDVIFNNAGIQTKYMSDYLETPYEDFNTCFQVNTIAPMMICYHFIPNMVNKGFGRIINTTSGIQYEAEQAAYSGSKAALDKCTIDLATKYAGTDILINLVDPGWCRTDMGGEYAPNDVKDALPGVILGALVDRGVSGRIIRAIEYSGMELSASVDKLMLENNEKENEI